MPPAPPDRGDRREILIVADIDLAAGEALGRMNITLQEQHQIQWPNLGDRAHPMQLLSEKSR